MTGRRDRLGALIGGFTFAVLLAFASAQPSVAGTATGMSAPAAPRTSITSAPLDSLPSAHACGCGAEASHAAIDFPVQISAAANAAAEGSESHRFYGPLYRRPPPHLS